MKFNFVAEIPLGTRAHLEIATGKATNPIRQHGQGDTPVFQLGEGGGGGGIPFNSGKMPQTWQNPQQRHMLTKTPGDNAPLDLIELSDTPLPTGSVRAIRVLGALALISDAKTDWHLLGIDDEHPLAQELFSEVSIEQHFPGKLAAVREWLKSGRLNAADGQLQPANTLAFNEQFLPRPFAHAVVWATHHAWTALCRGEFKSKRLWLASPMPAAASSGVNSASLTTADLGFVHSAATRLLLREFINTAPATRRTSAMYKRIRKAFVQAQRKLADASVAATAAAAAAAATAAAATTSPSSSSASSSSSHLDFIYLPDLAATCKAMQFYDVDCSVDGDFRVSVPHSPPSPLAARIARVSSDRGRERLREFFQLPADKRDTQAQYDRVGAVYTAACTRAMHAENDSSLTPEERQRIDEQVKHDLSVACEALRSFGLERDPATQISIPYSYRSMKRSNRAATAVKDKQTAGQLSGRDRSV